MIRFILSRIVAFTVVPIAVYSVQRFSPNPIGSTAIWWLIQFSIIAVFIVGSVYFFKTENKPFIHIFSLYLAWNIFSLARGFFVAEIYWDYKGLINNGFALLLSVVVYIASDKEKLQLILSYFIKFALPLAILTIPFLNLGMWGWYMLPVSILIFFFPAVKLHWKIILLLISLIGIFENITVRSHVLKYSIPILLLFIYYFRFFIHPDLIIKTGQKILLIAPWIFFGLGVSGVFNVFKVKEYIDAEKITETVSVEGEQDITQDSRTFIYREVLQSAQKNKYWLLGRSPARGNETEVFGDIKEEITGRRERLRNEANVPNVFTWMGIIGVILYFLVFSVASTVAINKSNNIYIKLIGLYVAFRWAYAWVEDYYSFNINTLTIWLMIGLCFSASFRQMNNMEVKLWARGIFDKKYNIYRSYLNRDVQQKKLKLKTL